jgi:hypothetical protein
MQERKSNWPVIIGGAVAVVFLIMAVVIWQQSERIADIQAAASNDKIQALSQQQAVFNDSIAAHNERFRTLQAKFKGIDKSREVTAKALTINKSKSNEKVHRIISANDSIVIYLNDSVLRAAGHR